MNPVGIGVVVDKDEDHMSYTDDILNNLIVKETMEIIESSLENSELRKDWIKLRHNLKVPKHRRQRIREEIMKILEENEVIDDS
jgi:hypothetical protein